MRINWIRPSSSGHVEVKVYTCALHTVLAPSIDMDSSTTDNGSSCNSGEQVNEREEAVLQAIPANPVPTDVHVAAESSSDQSSAHTELTDPAPVDSPTLAQLDDSAISTTPLKASEHHKGLLDAATEYINDHIKAFHRLPWIIGGVGVVLLIRFYPHMAFRRYRRPSDIPRQLLENNARLTGVVAMTGWDSVGVWHVPMWRRVLRWQHQPSGESKSYIVD